MTKLSPSQIASSLAALPEWSELNAELQRTYKFKDFVAAMKFVNKVAHAAEAAQHHPDVLIRWNLVTLTLSTHDAGGITVKDFDFAKKADALATVLDAEKRS